MIITRFFAVMAQSAEHVLGKDEVTGSNPVNSSKPRINMMFMRGFFVLLQESKTLEYYEKFRIHPAAFGFLLR